MRYISVKRTIVKSLIYRLWVLLTTYALLLITGQSITQALIPTLAINAVWLTSYFFYDRLWQRIGWGIELVREKRTR